MKLQYFTMIYDLRMPSQEARAKSNQLLIESAYMTEYIMRAMNKEFKFDCARINLECTSQPLRKGFRKFDSVHDIDVPFDDIYFSLAQKEKEQMLYNTLVEGIKILCETKNWDYSLFEKHLIALRDNNFKVDFYYMVKQSPDKKTVAKIYCEQTMTEAKFFIDFFQKRKLVQRKLLMVAPTELMRYRFLLHEIKWIDNNIVQTYNSIHKLTGQVSLD